LVAQISLACIAASTVVFVVFAVATLRAARDSMKRICRTLDRIDQRLEELSSETMKLMQSTRQVTLDAQDKLNSLSPLFASIGRIGQSVQQVSDSVRQMSSAVADTMVQAGRTVQSRRQQIADAMEWAATGYELWKKWQARRAENSREENP